MTARSPYEYVVVRVVPDIARGEFINAGVILYSQQAEFLQAIWHLDATRLLALAPDIDVDAVARSLEAITDCVPSAGDTLGQRFRWLTTPRSTIVQTSPIHTGLTADPQAELHRLAAALA